MSTIKRRIKTLEFYPGFFGCELPIDCGVSVIPSMLPGGHFRLHLRQRVNPSIQALLDEHVQLNLRHVQPATLLRRIHELKPVPQCLGQGGANVS